MSKFLGVTRVEMGNYKDTLGVNHARLLRILGRWVGAAYEINICVWDDSHSSPS